MKKQETINVIEGLPIKNGTDKFNEKISTAIRETANVIAPILTTKNMRIVSGGTNPTSQRSYARIYLEPVTNTSHDSRHTAYQVIRTWEFQTHSKYGFQPISGKLILNFLRQLTTELDANNG